MDTFFGVRLKEQRLALELSQQDFAEKCGVKKRAQINYEASERAPDVNYLAKAAAIGCDVNYIIEGRRTTIVKGLNFNEEQVTEGVKSFLLETYELNWLRMAPDADFEEVVRLAVHHVKETAGVSSDYFDSDERGKGKDESLTA